jgi:Na+/H+ antiporter NhaD/arsenite permease-like protein
MNACQSKIFIAIESYYCFPSSAGKSSDRKCAPNAPRSAGEWTTSRDVSPETRNTSSVYNDLDKSAGRYLDPTSYYNASAAMRGDVSAWPEAPRLIPRRLLVVFLLWPASTTVLLLAGSCFRTDLSVVVSAFQPHAGRISSVGPSARTTLKRPTPSTISPVLLVQDAIIEARSLSSHTNSPLSSSMISPYPVVGSSTSLLATKNTKTMDDEEEEEEGGTLKENLIKTGTATVAVIAIGSFLLQNPWLQANANIAMIGIFVLGYIGIIFEEIFEFNKAGVALLMSTALWVTYADFFGDASGKADGHVLAQLGEQLAEVSDICFFLLAASAIVEVVDSHQGFKVVTDRIQTTSKKELFWTIAFLTFFLSAILNNLTVTIVMVSLLRKLVPNYDDRRLFGAMVVVAANAGGVWTPIGDVTTTMLWINNQLSTVATVTDLFIPSMACLITSVAFLVRQVEEDDSLQNADADDAPLTDDGRLMFWAGIVTLLSVPIFNELTGLPPYLAMLTGLGAMYVLTDILHLNDKQEQLKVPTALARLDTSGILFFLGILMSIGVLDKSGLLKQLAVFLSDNLPSIDIIATAIGLFSAIIDNVPLVAATMYVQMKNVFGHGSAI